MSYITDKFDAGEVKFRTGVAGWIVGDEFRPLMDDAMAELFNEGLVTAECVELTSRARAAHVVGFLDAYAESYTGPSDEERAEARAAHGAGVQLVNVVTGHKWTT